MNQFKDIFLGEGTRPYTRAVNSQACIRVSGKHNDLEEVGADTYHHTLFEMLGNWSFGDFYKKEAITWAWHFLTTELNFPKEKLYATVYETDEEAAEIWRTETDINPKNILPFGKKDNFWEMAETGPCGPCSEIHLDRGPDYDDKTDDPTHNSWVNSGSARYIELWNLVFIQYNRKKDGTFENLPKTHVDTGMGLERILAYLNGTASNYNTDLFIPIIEKITELTGKPYSEGKEGMPHRVMADHIRTLTFAIADNVRPSNEGRGYVLRRILRRALRYAQKLGTTDPILHKLVEPVVEIMGTHFESIKSRRDYIETMIKAEEDSFLRTLESGTDRLNDLLKTLASKNQTELSGEDAFKLYDTYGFPFDLTRLIAEESGITVDETTFQTELEQQKTRSRQAPNTSPRDTELVSGSHSIEPELDQVPQVHSGVYTDTPGGGEAIIPKTDTERFLLARHHTGTHLLHAALKKVLGSHIEQAGSLVEPHRLRFDFTHMKAMSREELEQVEADINQNIKKAIAITTEEKPIEEAKAEGACATFGEKYDDIVRVVKIGETSLELCGGNHVSNTKDLESAKLLTETAVATGTRRIEALIGTANIQKHQEKKSQKEQDIIKTKQSQLKAIETEISKLDDTYPLPNRELVSGPQTIAQLTEDLKAAEKTLQKLKSQKANSNIENLESQITDLPKNAGKLLIANLENHDIPMLRSLSDTLLNKHHKILLILSSTTGNLIVKRSPELAPYNANKILQNILKETGGRGGGKPDMAQAGSADPKKLTKLTPSDIIPT